MSWPTPSLSGVRSDKPRDFRHLSLRPRIGLGFASPLWRVLSAWTLLPFLSGCLVTEPWSPPEPANVPPIIQADPSNPSSPEIGSIVWLNTDDPSPREWEFAVVVISEDPLRPLEAHWRILKQNDRTPAYTTISLDTGERIRHVRINVTSSALQLKQCHRLELAVSGSFLKIPNLERVLFDQTTMGHEEDLAKASWWIWEGKGSQTLDDQKLQVLNTCNAIETVPSNSTTPIAQGVQ